MIGFPLLLVPLAIFNMVVFITPGVEWSYVPYTFTLMSGQAWGPTLGDSFIVLSLVLLMFEFIKATSHGKSIVEHLLSILLAGGAAAEFLMVTKTGNSLFALFVVICFVDMFAGFAASLRRARRTTYDAPGPTAVPAYPMTPAAPRAEPAAPVPPRAEPAKAEPSIVVLPRSEPTVKVDPVQKVEP